MVEDGLKKRLVATDGFPFTQLLAEFRHRLPQPLKEVLWTRPDFEGLVVGDTCCVGIDARQWKQNTELGDLKLQ